MSSDPAALPPDWREWYEERAAIREFDGQQPRAMAEHLAMLDTRAAMREAERERR